METNQVDDWAEKYALGQMAGEEKARFEDLLAKNPSLLKKVNFYKELVQAIESDSDVLQFRQVVSEIGQEYLHTERERHNRKIFVRALLAAAVFLLLLFMTFLLNDVMHKPHTATEIYATYYHPYKTGITFRSGSISTPVAYEKACKLYEDGQYRESVAIFDQLLKVNPEDRSALLYSGVARMELGEFRKAETNFRAIIDQGNSLYVDQAEWYCGLCLLMQDDKNRAMAYFSKLAMKSGYYQKQAKSLLKYLK